MGRVSQLGGKLIHNLIERESNFDPDAKSIFSAKGMMQIRDIVFADIKGRYNKK